VSTSAEQLRDRRSLGDLAPVAVKYAGVPGAFVLVLAVLMTWQTDLSWERFLRGYTTAFMFVLSICLGGLFFTMLQHLARAGWSVVLRRIAEGLAGNLRWLWILFIPIAVGMMKTNLYGWTHPQPGDETLLGKVGYLSPAFWTIRAIFYFAVWGGLAHYFLRKSLAQDATGDPRITLRMEAVAAPGMILYAFTQTFAVIDWVMALEPHWYSTMFGVYFFAASCAGFGSTLILLCYGLRRAGRLTESITTEHYHEMGKFLFAFGIVFWSYIAYSQYMLIWYADIQEETTWYLIRQIGSWGSLSLLLVFGHFVIPFFALISRIPKRRPALLALIAGWVLFIHYIDMYWLTMPQYPAELVAQASSYPELVQLLQQPGNVAYDMHWHPVDVCCVVGLAGIVLAATARSLAGCALIPQGDPRLAESLAFEDY
jgi:hypothetical protein